MENEKYTPFLRCISSFEGIKNLQDTATRSFTSCCSILALLGVLY